MNKVIADKRRELYGIERNIDKTISTDRNRKAKLISLKRDIKSSSFLALTTKN